MSENSLPELPIIIVGKDRTRMTFAVIDALLKHIKNANPYFICVSDRSRAGHDKAIENHLNEVGIVNYQVLRTLPEEDRYGWGAAMNLGLSCACDVCQDATCALVLDNDWILQRDLDIDKYLYAFAFSSIGAITFKHIYFGTNVSLKEVTLSAGDTYLLRSKGSEERYSFTAELGCMLLTKRLYGDYGKFKENCKTDSTEWDFCDWYNTLSDERKNTYGLWFATDKELRHDSLNGIGHVFTHVGIVSQHEGRHQWDCPEEYRHLSDDKADEQVCKGAVMNSLIRVEETGKDDEVKIEWAKYFDRIYVHFFVDNGFERMPRLRAELERVGLLGLPILEWDYGTRCIYDDVVNKHASRKCMMSKTSYVNHSLQLLRDLRRAKAFGYKRILVVEDDIAFLKDISSIRRMLSNIPKDAEIVQFDKFIDGTKIEILAKLKKEKSVNSDFIIAEGCNFASATCNAYLGSGIDKAISYMESGLVSVDRISTSKEIRCAIAKTNMCVQVIYGNSENLTHSNIDFLHDCYFNQGIAKDYADYAVPEGYGAKKIYEEPKKEKGEDPENEEEQDICWRDYADRIYLIHFSEYIDRQKDIMAELDRVGIAKSEIFEIRKTYRNPVEQTIRKLVRGPKKQIIMSLFLETSRILSEARTLGYKRIMIIQDDIKFQSNKTKIKQILDAIPKGYNIVQMSKFYGNDKYARREMEQKMSASSINEWFYDGTGSTMYSGACYILQNDGIEQLLDLMSNTPCNEDLLFTRMTKRAIAIEDIGVQREYEVTCNKCNKTTHITKKKGRKFVSVYAIAKNEASVAARWYDCVREADEVCVLDTGSTDDTVKILRDLGADVTVKTYEDWSFAVARNDSMKLVSPESEILFTLDLDETIAPGWRKKLEDSWIAEEKKGKNPVGASYKYIWSFYDDGREMQSFAVRKVHKNGVGKWKYRCHELLQEINGYSFFINDFVVEHHQNRQTSRSKYLGLLEKDAKEMPEDDRSAYYYARELMYESRWEEAIAEFKRHLMLRSAGWNCERASSMRNIAYCYRHLKNEDEYELWLWKAAEEDKTNREATYFLGEKAMEKKDYRTAVKVFERCVAIEEPSLEYISMPLVWTARPWFLYAQALWWVNRWNDAVEASKKAMEIESDNAEVRSQYENMKATRDKYAKGNM